MKQRVQKTTEIFNTGVTVVMKYYVYFKITLHCKIIHFTPQTVRLRVSYTLPKGDSPGGQGGRRERLLSRNINN